MENFRIVAEACDGLEAIAKAGKILPDIVLLDIGLPLLNGIDAAPRIRRASPASKIIFLTQEQDSDVRTAAFAAGAERYLLKSRVVAELRHTIDAVGQISGRDPLPKHLEIPQSDPRASFRDRLKAEGNSRHLAAVYAGKAPTDH
jgi:DNA-binding NarL/FixJ family response regulator